MKTDPSLVAIALILMLIPGTVKANRRSKRSNTDIFNVLLSIYKMNPLKHSSVFKAFSNRILLPRPDEHRTALNYNLNESREKENNTNTKLKDVEVINHATHKPVDRPLYIETGVPEKFEPGHFLSKLVTMNQIDVDLKRDDDSDIFDDDLVEANAEQSKLLKKYANYAENNVSRNFNERIPEVEGNLQVLSSVNNKVANGNDFEETIVFK